MSSRSHRTVGFVVWLVLYYWLYSLLAHHATRRVWSPQCCSFFFLLDVFLRFSTSDDALLWHDIFCLLSASSEFTACGKHEASSLESLAYMYMHWPIFGESQAISADRREYSCIRSAEFLHIVSIFSVFPTEHSLRTCTQVRHECTQVHDVKRSSKLAKSVPFGANKTLICHSQKRYESEVTDFVPSQAFCMHAIAIEAWISGYWRF